MRKIFRDCKTVIVLSSFRYLCNIADSQGDLLRENSVRQLSDNLWALGREYSVESCVIDTTGLSLAIKHLSSPFLAPRLAGLHQINVRKFVQFCTFLKNFFFLTVNHKQRSRTWNGRVSEAARLVFFLKVLKWAFFVRMAENLANYLQTNEIVQTVFGPNLHVELVKQSHHLLNFLALREKLTKQELDCVWSTSHVR